MDVNLLAGRVKIKETSALPKGNHAKADAFRKMVVKLLEGQGQKAKAAGVFGQDPLIEIDGETRAAAQELISEDGYFGDKQTSERILCFARGLAGGEPAKFGILKDAVIQGFKEAEKIWGDELPEICERTFEAVMNGFAETEAEYCPVAASA